MSRADDDLVGQIVLIEPSMKMVEVLVASRLLDIALTVSLDMEGGHTGLHGCFRPSRLVPA